MTESHSKTVLVLGGGVAGMTAAKELARLGHKVHLVERDNFLGGLVPRLSVAGPGHEPHANIKDSMIEVVEGDDNITIHTATNLVKLEGKAPMFKATLEGSDMIKVDAGAIIVATGARPFDPDTLPEFKYGRSESVISSIDFEILMIGDPVHPKTEEPLKDVGFVQCVGSRMETRGNPWCSNICCKVTLKQAHLIKERSPDTNVFVYYMDLRAFDRGDEELYTEVKLKGVRFFRGIPSEVLVRKDGSLKVRAEDASLGKVIEKELDLLVLAVGLEPQDGTPELMKVLGIPATEDGFFPIENPEMAPFRTGVDGIFVAGTAEFPKSIKASVLQARAAALEASLMLTNK